MTKGALSVSGIGYILASGIGNVFSGAITEAEYLNEMNALKRLAIATDWNSASYLNPMFKKFASGSGGVYESEKLTEAVKKNKKTQDYIAETKQKFIDALRKSDSPNSDEVINTLLTQLGHNDNSIEIAANSKIDPLNYGYFDSPGLALAIHGWNKKSIYVSDYSTDGNHFKGKIHYVFEDTFGLDSSDISAHGYDNSLVQLLTGFQAWYMLQHDKKYNGKYKPFTTRVEIEEDFEGNFEIPHTNVS